MNRSAFVAVVGVPNVGKSTFINKFLEQEVSISTHKAQTTRDKIIGVFTKDDIQIVFLDSPGLHIIDKEINLFMLKESISAIDDADLVLFMVEYKTNNKNLNEIEEKILKYCFDKKKKVVLIINKLDKAGSPKEFIEAFNFYKSMNKFIEVIPLSSLKGFNRDILIKDLKKYIPKHPFYYPEDYLSDKNDRFMVSELIREQILLLTNEEVPYDTAVEIEKYSSKDEVLDLDINIILSRESQKRIIIGKKGSMLQKIKERSIERIKETLFSDVKLRLFVKVDKNWNKSSKKLEKFGYKNDINIDSILK